MEKENKELELRASLLTLFYYEQEFKKDLLETVVNYSLRSKNIKDLQEKYAAATSEDKESIAEELKENKENVSTASILEVIYAMYKTDCYHKNTKAMPYFEFLDTQDLDINKVTNDVIGECAAKFFRIKTEKKNK